MGQYESKLASNVSKKVETNKKRISCKARCDLACGMSCSFSYRVPILRAGNSK